MGQNTGFFFFLKGTFAYFLPLCTTNAMTSGEEEIGGDIGLLICWEERKRSKGYINIDGNSWEVGVIVCNTSAKWVKYWHLSGHFFCMRMLLYPKSQPPSHTRVCIYIYSKNTTFVPHKFVTIVMGPIKRH